jgi:hypothetical protein
MKRRSDISIPDASFYSEAGDGDISMLSNRSEKCTRSPSPVPFVPEFEDISAEVDARLQSRDQRKEREKMKEMGVPVSEKRKRRSSGIPVVVGVDVGNGERVSIRGAESEVRVVKKMRTLSDDPPNMNRANAQNTQSKAETTPSKSENPRGQRRAERNGRWKKPEKPKKVSGESRFSEKQRLATEARGGSRKELRLTASKRAGPERVKSGRIEKTSGKKEVPVTAGNTMEDYMDADATKTDASAKIAKEKELKRPIPDPSEGLDKRAKKKLKKKMAVTVPSD